MCRRVNCPTCGRPTWAGCGLHIEQALAGVPKAERCQCDESASEHQTSSPEGGSQSWFKRLFG
jgi:hypothetical protein